MKIRSMQTCIMSSLLRCIFRCSVFRYVTLDNFFQTLLLIVISFTLVANKYLLTYSCYMLNKNCPGNESLTIALTDLQYFSDISDISPIFLLVNGIDRFIQKFDFHKMLWILCWNITSHRSKQPEIGNVQDDGNYSILSQRVVKVC